MSVMSEPPKKKDVFQLWTDSKEDGTRLDFKNATDMRAGLDALAASEKTSPEEKAWAALRTQEERDVAKRVSELIEEYPQLKAARTPFQKRMAVRPILRKLHEQIGAEKRVLDGKQERLDFMKAVVEAGEGFPKWQEAPSKLERNDCSRLHNLVAFLKLQSKHMRDLQRGDDPESVPWEEVVPFVVQHDWAGAFKNAGDYESGGFKLPYEMCAFEFRITGRSVTVLAFQGDEEEPKFTCYCQFGEYWVSHDHAEEKNPHFVFALTQIKAICVALDAEVAAHTVIRANERANRRRVAEEKVPFYSYHVVSLAHRSRVANALPRGPGDGKRRRLHFRRGHWRRVRDDLKTWVRWCLAGDPDLGFIDKEYRL